MKAVIQRVGEASVEVDGEKVSGIGRGTDVEGEILCVSQFTLAVSVRKGNRPSYIGAAGPETAVPLYEAFCTSLSAAIGKEVGRGIFGADMQVSLVNDGPVTIWMDSKNLI